MARGEGGMRGRGGACVAGETAIAAGGTHPTGMYSCSVFCSFIFSAIGYLFFSLLFSLYIV